MLSLIAVFTLQSTVKQDLTYLHQVAKEVVQASKVEPDGEIRGTGKNATGYTLRVPGGTQNYYPAFWIRDAAMMLGGDLIAKEEIEGWIQLVASTQPGEKGLTFPHNLTVPPYSIPDHITLKGEACWYPGAYAEQGVGVYGLLPPADDAFYFIQMVYDYVRLSPKSLAFLKKEIKTGWGGQTVLDVTMKAFTSVAVATNTGLVLCDEKQTRVDWGFCDSVRKTGSALMPSLLRWNAARQLSDICRGLGLVKEAGDYRQTAELIRKSILATFYQQIRRGEACMISATGLGNVSDIWAAAYAVWLGVLPKDKEADVSRALLWLYKNSDTFEDGQIRHMPQGYFWEKSSSGEGEYQNGGYWGTPTGWVVYALAKVDKEAAKKLLAEYVAHIKANRAKGAPFEWINPATGKQVNAHYASSAGLVYISLQKAKL